MSDLERLIDAVEAGYFDADEERNVPRFNAFADAFESALGMRPSYLDGWGAYRGSLDAAHRLHEALLPGWVVHDFTQYPLYWHIVLNGNTAPHFFHGKAATPARAWLLAALKALKATTKTGGE